MRMSVKRSSVPSSSVQHGAQEAVRPALWPAVQQRAGHAQVHDQHATGVEPEDEVLAAPLDRLDARADDALAKGRLVGALDHRHRLARIRRDASRPTMRRPDHARLEVAPYGLDFGQLRHSSTPGFFSHDSRYVSPPVEDSKNFDDIVVNYPIKQAVRLYPHF